MAKRITVALVTMLASMVIAFPALGQPVSAPAPTDPNARLTELQNRSPATHTAADLDARLKQLENNPRQFEAMYKVGSKVGAFCANCHGEGGNSLKPDIPNLAGQNPSYLLEQMRQFSEGERRNEFMQRLIRVLSLDEKIGMVIFYSKQEVTHKPPSNDALVSKGQAYYNKTCFRCHGDEGRGNEQIARIAGQQPDYLDVTLKRYREGSNIRNGPLMAANARLMTDADIAAVVAYVSSMK